MLLPVLAGVAQLASLVRPRVVLLVHIVLLLV